MQPDGPNARANALESRFEPVMLVFAALTVPVLAFEEADTASTVRDVALALDWIIWFAFAVEIVVLLRLADDRRAWLKAHPLELAIVLLTPPFLVVDPVLRLLRLLRLIELAVLARHVFTLNGLRWTALLTAMLVLSGGAGLSMIEPAHDYSLWDGVWWALVTVTGVGYGDIVPSTDSGRIIGIGVMVAGTGFVALLTAALASRFALAEAERFEDEMEDRMEEELQVIEEIGDAERAEEVTTAALMAELRAVSERLAGIEARLDRRDPP